MGPYTHVRHIGSGSFGSVSLVQTRTGATVVMKTIETARLSSREREASLLEIRVLASMDHVNIIALRDYFLEGSKLQIVMDFAEGGDLHEKIMTTVPTERQVSCWFTQLCCAVKHLHDRKVLHRDIKSKNCFLTSTLVIKLGDFGLAKALESTLDLCRTKLGTPHTACPEMFNDEPYDARCDMWSVGCVLYHMMHRRYPFEAPTIRELAKKISAGNFDNPLHASMNGAYNGVIDMLLQTDPARRSACRAQSLPHLAATESVCTSACVCVCVVCVGHSACGCMRIDMCAPPRLASPTALQVARRAAARAVVACCMSDAA